MVALAGTASEPEPEAEPSTSEPATEQPIEVTTAQEIDNEVTEKGAA